ncbi:MAG TPA: sigma-70 family RNA polymerase sigma factor [bacterium]|nr:sigma-70 family RNA polymerase sigma factor [bacterium]
MQRTRMEHQPDPPVVLPDDDAEIIERVKGGDTGAFDVIVSRYKDRVFSYCMRMLGDPETATETAQDIFMRAYRYLDNFRGDSKFSTWFYTIVSSTCKNAASYHGLRARHREDSHAENEDGEYQSPVDRLQDASLAPELNFERRELARTIRSAIDTLPDSYKQVIVMKDINDFSYEEISNILNCKIGTVKSRLARAREMTRERLLKSGLLRRECE